MLVSKIVGRDRTELTKEELQYIINAKIKKAYVYKNANKFYTFCIFEDGSITKHDADTDDDVGSSKEEMEQLKKEGYEIDDVTDEYVFE